LEVRRNLQINITQYEDEMKTDATGVKQTCPIIDKVISQINVAIRELKSASKNKECSELDSIEYALNHLTDVEDFMETIRSDNEKLREVALGAIEDLEREQKIGEAV